MTAAEGSTSRAGRPGMLAAAASAAVVLGWIAALVEPAGEVLEHRYLDHGLLLVSADLLAEGLDAHFARYALLAFGGMLVVAFVGSRVARARRSRPGASGSAAAGARTRRSAWALHLAAAGALLAHGGLHLAVHRAQERARETSPNVLLVVVDTLRADHLGHAGHAAARTPALDALARDSVVFGRARSAASWTRPAIASILTATTPVQHGITRESARQVLTPPHVTMQEFFRDRGYTTAALYTNPHVKFGLDQQFDLTRYTGNARAAVVADWAIEYLDAPRDGPFFLMVHLNDPHDAYEYREGFSTHPPEAPLRNLKTLMPILENGAASNRTPEELQPVIVPDDQLATLKDHYDGEIAYTDHHLGRVLAHLATLGIDDDTIVVVTADHGEEFLEHGSYWHGLTLYDEVLRVPLILHVPGVAGRVVEEAVGTIDLFPTLAELVDGRPVELPGWDGRSLVPLMRGASRPARPVFSASEFRDEMKYSLVFEDTKLIRYAEGPVIGLFDLGRDPREQHDLSRVDADRLAAMEAMLARYLPQDVAVADAEPVELDEESLKALQQLGYAGN